jgi:hypothetical protein
MFVTMFAVLSLSGRQGTRQESRLSATIQASRAPMATFPSRGNWSLVDLQR